MDASPDAGASDRRFVVIIAVVAVLGLLVVGIGFWRAQEAAWNEARSQSQMHRARVLLSSAIYTAEHRFRMQRYRDQDDDGRGEFAPLPALFARDLLAAEDWRRGDGAPVHGPYAYHALVGADADAAERRFLVIAQPLRSGLRGRMAGLGALSGARPTRSTQVDEGVEFASPLVLVVVAQQRRAEADAAAVA